MCCVFCILALSSLFIALLVALSSMLFLISFSLIFNTATRLKDIWRALSFFFKQAGTAGIDVFGQIAEMSQSNQIKSNQKIQQSHKHPLVNRSPRIFHQLETEQSHTTYLCKPKVINRNCEPGTKHTTGDCAYARAVFCV